MRKISGGVFQSLDGVMQAPGGPSEDWTGGFSKGGWLPAVADESIGDAIDRLFKDPFDLLLGRRTYDIFAAYWPYAEGDNKPMGEMFDRVGKYAVTHGNEPLDWQNSHRVASLEALADLKQTDGPDLVIQGSSTLYPQLLAAGLLDRLTLMTFPVVLGRGKRLFGDGTPPGTMKLIDHQVSAGGNIIATYEPAGEVRLGSFMAEPPSQREHDRQEQMKREEGVA
jgi:dihydrofolate reductase